MKTPKEKAKKLVDGFKIYAQCGENPNLELYNAKQCALICVDEKIETLLNVIGSLSYMYSEYELELHRDLQEVKQEINKL